MPTPSRWMAVLLILHGLLALAAQDAQPTKVEIGAVVPAFAFRELVGGDGRVALSAFRGQPVLIVNWTDTDFGRGAAEQLEKVAQELVPKGLVSILHDTHNKSREAIEAAVLRLFPGNPSWRARTHKLPFAYEDNGPPPDIALIGVDGRLLVAGSYTSDFKRAVDAAEDELKKLRKGWGEHDVARDARAQAFGDHALAEAHSAVQAALAEEPELPELTDVLAEVAARREALAAAVPYLLEQGEALRAQEAAQAYARAVEGDAGWESEARALVASFDTPELAAELSHDAKLAKILKPWSKSAPKSSHAGKLRKLAEQAGDTPVGRRALHLATLVDLVTGED